MFWSPNSRFCLPLPRILEMKGEGVEGRSELDFEVSEEKMWTFDDVFEDLGLKKGKLV